MADVGKLLVGAAYAAMLAAIASERVDRLHAALAALAFVLATSLALDYADPAEAARAVDLDVLGLVVVASALSWFMEDSGIAASAARLVVRYSRGNPVAFALLASAVSGFLSLFLENVSVVIILAPVVFRASRVIGVDPVPVVIAMALSSNLSGSALLVGDPQAAIVASAYNLDFVDFIVYNGRPSMFFMVTAAMAAAIASLPLYTRFGSGRGDHATGGSLNKVPGGVRDRGYAAAVLAALAAKVVLLSLKNRLGLSLTEAAAPPVLALALVYGRRNPRALLKASLDYHLLGFLAAVFYLVGFIDEVSLTRAAADWLLGLSSDILTIVVVIVAASAVVSSIMDNVPFIAAMIPVINVIAEHHGEDPVVLAWALLLGATLGGNMTYVGASANYTAVRLLEREGYDVSFGYFARIGIPFTAVALAVGLGLYLAFYGSALKH